MKTVFIMKSLAFYFKQKENGSTILSGPLSSKMIDISMQFGLVVWFCSRKQKTEQNQHECIADIINAQF